MDTISDLPPPPLPQCVNRKISAGALFSKDEKGEMVGAFWVSMLQVIIRTLWNTTTWSFQRSVSHIAEVVQGKSARQVEQLGVVRQGDVRQAVEGSAELQADHAICCVREAQDPWLPRAGGA